MTVTLNRKGQITIPQPIRALLDLQPGCALDFKVTEGGQVVLARAETQPLATRFAALRGVATVKMSTDEIMALTRGED
jgi:AbrB family looped-hinge helix DNA binding protein